MRPLACQVFHATNRLALDQRTPEPRAAGAGEPSGIKTTLAAIALALFACGSPDVSWPSPVGLWVWHEEWESAPPEIVEESGPQWTAPGALIRFCPDGRFRVATGYLYRGSGVIVLGSSDGLTLYEGRWRSGGNGVEVQYQLTDAEIRFTGYEQARAKRLVDRPIVEGNSLRFTYHRPHDDRRFEMQFEAAVAMPERVAPRFIECAPPHE